MPVVSIQEGRPHIGGHIGTAGSIWCYAYDAPIKVHMVALWLSVACMLIGFGSYFCASVVHLGKKR